MKAGIIVRTKNEAAWIAQALDALTRQTDVDADIVVVDNESTDGTLEIATRYPCRVLSISDRDFSYGRALNIGIRETGGDLVAIISGHCIPTSDRWLRRLCANFSRPSVAGVYGRQEPLPDSTAFDKRDLWTTFGLDRRTQRQDYFFHNANSMLRRAVWEAVPFDEDLPGVEDRDWARRVQELGWQIVYEPRASVFHHHGIHQGRDERRAARVARVIELIQNRSTGESS
jgi:glycosyltransferase involved in cell wall biosynthesis